MKLTDHGIIEYNQYNQWRVREGKRIT